MRETNVISPPKFDHNSSKCWRLLSQYYVCQVSTRTTMKYHQYYMTGQGDLTNKQWQNWQMLLHHHTCITQPDITCDCLDYQYRGPWCKPWCISWTDYHVRLSRFNRLSIFFRKKAFILFHWRKIRKNSILFMIGWKSRELEPFGLVHLLCIISSFRIVYT